ncbi:MAG: YidB family protein [Rhodoblastus sp.]
MSEQDLLAGLAQALPGVIDKLTPRGRLPTADELSAR